MKRIIQTLALLILCTAVATGIGLPCVWAVGAELHWSPAVGLMVMLLSKR